MDTRTGNIHTADEVAAMPKKERQYMKPVYRDLRPREQMNRQIQKYSTCGCGSGKKFKFCCFNKPVLPTAK